MTAPSLSPPIIVPRRGALPVILSIPHSGRDYPAWLDRLALHGRSSLIPLEDPLVDRLAWRALALGVGAVIATAPRAAIDCNRSEAEIDPATVDTVPAGPPGPRARGGLGIVPGRTPRHGFLWRRPLTAAEFEARLAQAHRPFHAALAAQIDGLVAEFGGAILLDCHSMPPRRRNQPAIVLGNRHCTTAGAAILAEAARLARGAGYGVALNDPYAGGWIVERHGAPARDVHAIQIEIDRSCYLDSTLAAPGPGFDRAARLIETLVLGLGAMIGGELREAAE